MAAFFAKATVFMNDVDNYIYLQDETEEEHEEHDEEHEEGHDDHGGLILSKLSSTRCRIRWL